MPTIYELTHYMTHQGQQCVNVYHYLELQDNGQAEELAKYFAQSFVPIVASVQSQAVEHLAVVVKDLYDPSDYHTVLINNTTGGRAGDWLSAFDAYALAFAVGTNLTRSGRKALTGVPETDIVNGEPTAPIQTTLDAVAAVLSIVLELTLADYIPVVLNKGVSQWIANVIVDGVFRRLSTQNSRKTYTSTGYGFQTPLVGTRSVQPALTVPAPGSFLPSDYGDQFPYGKLAGEPKVYYLPLP